MNSDGLLIQADGVYPQQAIRQKLRITAETLARARQSGELPFVRKGKTFLYRGEALLKWLSPSAHSTTEAKHDG